MVNPVKFTRDSGCLARDEFLVISEGDHIWMYIFLFFFIVGHCTIFSLHMKAYVSASYDPRFFFECFENIWAIWFIAPLAKIARTPMTDCMFD